MKDLFSADAGGYAAFRPDYPEALYNFVFKHVSAFGLAWDAGTGNGQVAIDLARHFQRVVATDISEQQLINAFKSHAITYEIAGEKIDLPANSVDLVTVAQAIHWFDRPLFYKEVKRVAKQNAVIAVWGYGLLGVDGISESLIVDFYRGVVGAYWDEERKLIDDQYRSIGFPFSEIAVPPFFITKDWSLDAFEGYLLTWSAVRNYTLAKGKNPVPEFIFSLRHQWGSGTRRAVFPVFMRLGKV